jgi:hypothetical protein
MKDEENDGNGETWEGARGTLLKGEMILPPPDLIVCLRQDYGMGPLGAAHWET